jgi:hypothetical protein
MDPRICIPIVVGLVVLVVVVVVVMLIVMGATGVLTPKLNN